MPFASWDTACEEEVARLPSGVLERNRTTFVGSMMPVSTSAYCGSKCGLRGMTECWRAELRQYKIRVILVNPIEGLTDFYATAGPPQNKENPTKLRGEDIATEAESASSKRRVASYAKPLPCDSGTRLPAVQ